MEKHPSNEPQPGIEEMERMIDAAIIPDPKLRAAHSWLSKHDKALRGEDGVDEQEEQRIRDEVDKCSDYLSVYHQELATLEGTGYVLRQDSQGEIVYAGKQTGTFESIFFGATVVNVRGEEGVANDRLLVVYKGVLVEDGKVSPHTILMPVTNTVPEFSSMKSIDYYEERLMEMDPEAHRDIHSALHELNTQEERIAYLLCNEIRAYPESHTKRTHGDVNTSACIDKLLYAYTMGFGHHHYMLQATGEHNAYQDNKLQGKVTLDEEHTHPVELMGLRCSEGTEVGEDGKVVLTPQFYIGFRAHSDDEPTILAIDANSITRLECLDRLAREQSELPHPRETDEGNQG